MGLVKTMQQDVMIARAMLYLFFPLRGREGRCGNGGRSEKEGAEITRLPSAAIAAASFSLQYDTCHHNS